MKKLLLMIGFLSAVTLAVGVTFKLLHVSGGNQLFAIGYLALFLVFIPIWAYGRYRAAMTKTPAERIRFISGIFAAVTTGLGVLFKIMHLQGAGILFVTGALAFIAGFLPFYFYSLYKKSNI